MQISIDSGVEMLIIMLIIVRHYKRINPQNQPCIDRSDLHNYITSLSERFDSKDKNHYMTETHFIVKWANII